MQKGEKLRHNRKKQSRKTGFYYSFLTIVLLFCFLQIGYGAILNVGKIISYQGKVMKLENVLEESKARNKDLKLEKKMVTSDNSLEGIARNNLKMAGEDEVLIIINKKVETPEKKKLKVKNKNSKKKSVRKKTEKFEKPYIPTEVTEE